MSSEEKRSKRLLRRAPRGRDNRAGTTILETLCAFSVLMVAAFGAMDLYIAGCRSTKEAQQELTAARLMTNEREAWRIAAASGLKDTADAPLRSLTDEGRVLEHLKGRVTVAHGKAGLPGLFELTVQLHWRGAGGRSITRETATLLAAPEAAP